MRDTCDEIHRIKYRELRKKFIPLCLESQNRKYFNILRKIPFFIICALSMKYMPWHKKNKDQLSMTLHSYKINY